MAEKVSVITTDDIDGSPNAVSVTFGFDGLVYEIDLSEQHRADLDRAVAPYIAAGRRVSRSRRRSTAQRAAGIDRGLVRQWARDNGLEVSGRGRISAEIMRKYEEAH
ncbi:MAG TPA: Lsr2 family protein [Streptosporangiaceae bacterium]|jgi:hypothetical protein